MLPLLRPNQPLPEVLAMCREAMKGKPRPKPEGSSNDNVIGIEASQGNDRMGEFYWFPHPFETISGAAKDQVATDLVLGHGDWKECKDISGGNWTTDAHFLIR